MTFAVTENGKKVLTMDEYIEREALYEKSYWHGEHPNVDNPFPDGVDAIDIKDVDAIPSADVAPVRHGRWLCVDTDTEQFFLCNRCKKKEYWESDYCPNCGAIMDLEEAKNAKQP